MDKYISVIDSLIISGFSIFMVFLILILIAGFVSLLKLIGEDEQETMKKPEVATKPKPTTAAIQETDLTDDEEIIAVISAAIAAKLNMNVPDINIKKINRVINHSTEWSIASRQEQMSSKL